METELIISEPYMLFPIDFVKKKFSSNLLSKNSCLLICIFCSHHTNIKYYDTLSWEIIDKEDLYDDLFQTIIRAVFKEGNKKKTNKNLEQLDALEKGHYKYRLITLLTIFFCGKQCLLPLVFFWYIHLLSF